MSRKFTKADREKAAATRKHNQEQRRLKAQQEIVATGTTELSMDKDVPMPPALRQARTNAVFDAVVSQKTTITIYDWWEVPLNEAIERLNNIKREYDRAAQIVLQRQSQAPAKPLTCWVWDHRKRPDMPKTAILGCKQTIADRSKAAFTNDGWIEPHDPTRKVHSIYCCSMTCYMAYNQLRPVGGLSRH